MEVDLEADRLGIFGEDILDSESLSGTGRHKHNCVISVLHDRIVHWAVTWEWELDQPISKSLINARLQ